MVVMQKRTRLMMVGVAVVAAVVAAVCVMTPRGLWGSAHVDVHTHGYKLTPAKKLGAYRIDMKVTDYLGDVDAECAGTPSDQDCRQALEELHGVGMVRERAEAIGVENVSGTGADYRLGEWSGDLSTRPRTLVFRGLWGKISDPDEAVDRFFDSIENDEQAPFNGVRFTGSREEFQPKGFKGALMRCQKSERAGRSQYPFCVWADYSTVAVTVHYGTFEEQM